MWFVELELRDRSGPMLSLYLVRLQAKTRDEARLWSKRCKQWDGVGYDPKGPEVANLAEYKHLPLSCDLVRTRVGREHDLQTDV